MRGAIWSCVLVVACNSGDTGSSDSGVEPDTADTAADTADTAADTADTAADTGSVENDPPSLYPLSSAWAPSNSPAHGVSITPDGRYSLVIESQADSVRLFDLDASSSAPLTLNSSGEGAVVAPLSDANLSDLRGDTETYSNTGAYLATNDAIYRVDLVEGEIDAVPLASDVCTGSSSKVNEIELSPDGARLAVSCFAGGWGANTHEVVWYDTGDWEESPGRETPVAGGHLAFSEDGTRLFAVYANEDADDDDVDALSVLSVIDTTTGSLSYVDVGSAVFDVLTGPTSGSLLVVLRSGEVWRWDNVTSSPEAGEMVADVDRQVGDGKLYPAPYADPVAYAEDVGILYVTHRHPDNNQDDRFFVIDLSASPDQRVQTLSPYHPTGIAVTSDGQRVVTSEWIGSKMTLYAPPQ